MSGIVFPTTAFGAVLTQSDRGPRSKAGAVSLAEARARRAGPPVPANDSDHDNIPEPGIDGKWPAWKVTTLVLASCAAFWGAVIWLALRMFG